MAITRIITVTVTCLKYLSLLNDLARKSSYRSFKSSKFCTYEIAFCPTPPALDVVPPIEQKYVYNLINLI